MLSRSLANWLTPSLRRLRAVTGLDQVAASQEILRLIKLHLCLERFLQDLLLPPSCLFAVPERALGCLRTSGGRKDPVITKMQLLLVPW